MRHPIRIVLLAAALAAAPVPASAQNVFVAGLVELSGTGATAGTGFNNGVQLAIREINAAGGLNGRRIDYSAFDTQTNPGVAKGLAQRAIDDKAYVILGPVFSWAAWFAELSAEPAMLSVPGFSFASRTKSWNVLIGLSAGTISASGV